ncbi:hypothetical protein [Streptomyces sp. NPDC007100]
MRQGAPWAACFFLAGFFAAGFLVWACWAADCPHVTVGLGLRLR